MRNKIVTLLNILLLCSIAVSASIAAETVLPGFEVVAENESLVLYLNPENTEFVVADKRTGKLWYSNPPNRRSEEKIARGPALEQIGAQFSIAYYTPGDNLRYMDNRNDSVAFGQYEVHPIPDGVRIEYVLGRRWSDASYLPVMISKDRFEELILSKLDKAADRDLFESSYELVTLEKISGDYQRVDIYRIDKEAVFGDYTLVSPGRNLNQKNKSALIELVADQIVKNRPDLADRRGLTADDFLAFRDREVYVQKNKLRAWDIEDMIALIKTIDYTPEDVAEDHLANGIAAPKPEYRTFNVVVEYTLDGDNLVVRVPLDEVSYPQNVLDENNNRVSLPLYTINILEFFGAGNMEENGYIFVPDGSGALINFNNGKTAYPAYHQQIYGADMALNPRKERSNYTQRIHLPVFGLKHDDGAMVGIVEQGEAFARLRADVAGRTNSYNTAFPEILVVPMTRTQLQGTVNVVVEGQVFVNEINVYQKRQNQGDVVIRYGFLPSEAADYVGMARFYQDYLVENGLLRRLSPEESVPFILELVGAVHVREPFVGVPRNVIKPLTTFDQAKEIVNELLGAGVDDIKLRYSGWLKGGLEHVFPSKLRLEGKVGTSAELESFRDFAYQNGIDLFLDVNFMNAHKHGLLDGFVPLRDASRYLNRQVARAYKYNLATYQLDLENAGYVVSPSKLPSVVSKFLAEYSKLGVDGISLGNMGTQVNSDYRESLTRLVDRQQALGILRQQFDAVQQYGFKALLDGGNAYTFAYADSIVNVPMESSGFILFDEDVPFMQIVLHGYVNYAGEPFNLAQNVGNSLLKAIETGASPYYLWTFEDSSVLKDSYFDNLYATNFRYWLQDAVESYKRINAALGEVADQRIVGHERLGDQVYVTEFENGDKIYVNYGEREAEIAPGISISQRDFRLVKGGEANEE